MLRLKSWCSILEQRGFTTNLPLNFIICIHNARKQPTIKHRHPCPFDVVRQHSTMGRGAFVSWEGIHYKREIIDDWMCPPTMFWTHWRNRNCAKTSRLKMLISVFHLTREIVPTTEHRWNCLTKTWLAKFRNSSSKTQIYTLFLLKLIEKLLVFKFLQWVKRIILPKNRASATAYIKVLACGALVRWQLADFVHRFTVDSIFGQWLEFLVGRKVPAEFSQRLVEIHITWKQFHLRIECYGVFQMNLAGCSKPAF